MKFARYLALLATISSLLLSLDAVAKTKNEGRLQLVEAVQIGSTQLSPGNYTVKWIGSGPAVQVTIMKSNKAVATASGTIINQTGPAPYDDVVLKPLTDNSNKMTIEEIDFGNRKEALRLMAN